MEKRQMIILCTIGDMNINFKSITEIKVDRNFSDVGDKFSIELIDSPGVTTYDLELYMNAGYRDIIFKYGDLNTNKLTSYKGTIWDYTNTFVGNIKRLTITGICDRFTGNNDGPSTYLYNIDWNSYFNIREDETQPYGAIQLANYRLGVSATPILYEEYRNMFLVNSKKIKLTGPSKKDIVLPIPDSFFSITNIPENPEDIENLDKNAYPEFYSLVKDTSTAPWGELHSEKTTNTTIVSNYPCFDAASTIYKTRTTPEKIVACEITENVTGINANGLDGTGLYINISNLISQHTAVTSQWPSNFNAYTNTQSLGSWGIQGPLKNKKEVFGDKTYINVLDKNKHIVGFRTDGDETKKDNNVFLNFIPNAIIRAEVNAQVLKNLKAEKKKGKVDTIDKTQYLYYYDSSNKLRGFLTLGANNSYDTFFIQANPNTKGFGGAGLVKSGEGVNISWIVKQLCILEGWKTKDEYIVQTELVPDSDAFIMQNQSAFEFIQKNLIPKAVTPAGTYYTNEGYYIDVAKPQGGFGIFFDSDGYLHFQPISQTNLERLDIDNLGYNIPNSPTISFQVNTKGTAFYNFQNTKINTTVITSGVEVEEVEIISDELTEDIRKTLGHNDTFDRWLGLSYNTVQNEVEKKMPSDKLVNYYNEGIKIQNIAIGLAQNALVSSPTTKLVSSGIHNRDDVIGNIQQAIKYIEDFTITANMNMWGDYRIKPAGIIKIANYVKGGANNSNTPQRHPSSGEYMIQKVSETISASGYIQSLDLLRFTRDLNKLINPYNINYERAASPLTAEGIKNAQVNNAATEIARKVCGYDGSE